jgi:hypothetical protein
MRIGEDAMTETDAGQPPTLGLGKDGGEARQTLRTGAERAERQRGNERDRAARSEKVKGAARGHDRLEGLADPAVRVMDERERRAWERRHDEPGRDPGAVYTRRSLARSSISAQTSGVAMGTDWPLRC